MAVSSEEKPASTRENQEAIGAPANGQISENAITEKLATLDVEATPSDTPTGPRKTPFSEPATGAAPDAAESNSSAVLTTEQQTSYNSLHNSVSEWVTIPGAGDGSEGSELLTDDERMWLTRDCLLRYLRASKWNIVTATQRLAGTLIWRRTYGVACVPPATEPKLVPDYISPENETGKQWVLGFDNEGRPCLYLNPSRQNTKRSDRQIEHLVFMLERVIDIMPPGQESLALLINFAETKSGQGASVGQGKQVLNILQSHYPERLGRALLCNLPWHIWAFMKVITPFIDPITRKKLVYDSPLQEHVPPSQLCRSHGGALEFEYDHTVYWPALNKLAEDRRAAMKERWVKGGKLVGEYESYLKGGEERSLKDDVSDNNSEQSKSRRSGGSKRNVVLISDKGADEDTEPSVEKLSNGTHPEVIPQDGAAVAGTSA